MTTTITDIATALLGLTTKYLDPALKMHVADPPPPVLDTGRLPLMYMVTGQASHSRDGRGFYQETRQYRLRVAVMPKTADSPANRELRVRPVIPPVLELFQRERQLGLAGILEYQVTGDSGPMILAEDYSGNFIGFDVTLDVTFIHQPGT